MTNLFLFGTLRHAPLLAAVLGHPAATEPARLADHAVRGVAGESFPMLAPQVGAEAAGLLLRDVDDAGLARLDRYEGFFDYAPRPVTVRDATGAEVAALCYAAPEGRWAPEGDWDLDDWAARWGGITAEAAAEAMRRAESEPADRIAALLPVMRARAWARQLGAEAAPQRLRSPAGSDAARLEVQEGGYEGFFRLERFTISHQRFDGSDSGPIAREGFVAFDAALVLPYDAARDEVLLIEQLRYGPILRGDPAHRVLEPIAGLIDAGEDPAETARREAVEEAHLHIDRIEPMMKVYPSPGYSTEFFHCFLGHADLAGAGLRLAGHPEEDEDIRTHVLPFDAALALVDSGEINVGPLAMMLLWLARHRAGGQAAGAASA